MARLTEEGRAGSSLSSSSPIVRVDRDAGFSLVEVLLVCVVIGTAFGLGVPSLVQAARMKETADAGVFLAAQFRLARQQAVMSGRHVAIVFESEPSDSDLVWRRCVDFDRDGVSRADIARGTDRCGLSTDALSQRFPHVETGYHDGVPPVGGGSAAPVRFGAARMAVFAPTGTASSGTVVLKGRGGTQVAIRVAGVTGRTRTLRYDRSRRRWTE